MFRFICLTVSLAACIGFSGCMGAGCYSGGCGDVAYGCGGGGLGCGPGAMTCNNCDGYSRDLSGPPMRRMVRNAACGGGCGDVYLGEWRNNPPNSCDPCEVRGGCGYLMSGLGNLFGYRNNDGCQTCYGGDRQFFGTMNGHLTGAVCGMGCAGYCDEDCGGSISCGTGACGGSCGLPVSSRANSGYLTDGCSSCSTGTCTSGTCSTGSSPTRAIATRVPSGQRTRTAAAPVFQNSGSAGRIR